MTKGELDWLEKSFVAIGCAVSGAICLYFAFTTDCTMLTLPRIGQIWLSKDVLIVAGALLFGVQSHAYKLQKRLIETFAKGCM